MSIDREFRIRITTVAETAAVKDTAEQLKQLGSGATEASEGLKETDAATKKAFASTKDFGSILKGLTVEFPALGQAARLAMNPIAIAVAGISSAFGIWSWRVKQAEESLAGLKLPDFKSDNVGHINANAEAWNKYAQSVKTAAQALNEESAAHARVVQNMREEAKLRAEERKAAYEAQAAKVEADRAAGKITPERAEFRKKAIESNARAEDVEAEAQLRLDEYGEKTVEMFDLRAKAEAARAEAAKIRTASPEDDAETLKKYEAMAAEAQKDRDKRTERIGLWEGYKAGELSFPEQLKAEAVAYAAYPGMNIDEALAADYAARQGDDEIISKARNFKSRMGARAGDDARRTDLLNQAAAAEGKANSIWNELPGIEANMGRRDASEQFRSAASDLASMYQMQAQLLEAMNKGKEQMSSQVGPAMVDLARQQADLAAQLAEVKRLIRAIEGKIGTTY